VPRLLAGRPATDSRPRGRDPVQATFLFKSAQAALAEHDLFNTVRLLQEAVLVDPTYWEAHKAIGECLLSLRRPGSVVAFPGLVTAPSRGSGLPP
jgi:Flp pilus assembly protein TadD